VVCSEGALAGHVDDGVEILCVRALATAVSQFAARAGGVKVVATGAAFPDGHGLGERTDVAVVRPTSSSSSSSSSSSVELGSGNDGGGGGGGSTVLCTFHVYEPLRAKERNPDRERLAAEEVAPMRACP
jgi:hypothetical protein